MSVPAKFVLRKQQLKQSARQLAKQLLKQLHQHMVVVLALVHLAPPPAHLPLLQALLATVASDDCSMINSQAASGVCSMIKA